MQKEREQLLLITSYNGFYQEDYKIPIHSLWHGVEVLPHAQPSYVTSSCKSAILCERESQIKVTWCILSQNRKLNSYLALTKVVLPVVPAQTVEV